MRKIIILVLIICLCIGNVMNVQATENSYGEDTINSSSFDKTYNVNVYATKSSSITIKYPVNLVLDGNEGTASYTIGARADISGNQRLHIVPEESFKLSEVNAAADSKSDITAVVTQEDTDFTQSELNLDDFSYVAGRVNAPLTAGAWRGLFEIHVYLEDMEG